MPVLRLAIPLLLIGVTAGSAAAADTEKGKLLFNQCKACHALEAGQNKLGPSLHGVFGRKAGMVEGFRYSKAMTDAGIVWDAGTMDAYLANPRSYIPNNRMTFVGLRKPEDRQNLIDYLEDATK